MLGWRVNWNRKARLDAVHYDHRLEVLDIQVLLDELPGELLKSGRVTFL